MVHFFAKNKTNEFDFTKPIAIFEPKKPARLLSSGNYLDGRVEMTNITSTSTYATLTFLELKCDDEKDYMCQCYYKGSIDISLERSPPNRISVQGNGYLSLYIYTPNNVMLNILKWELASIKCDAF